jgi:hypothetical protein
MLTKTIALAAALFAATSTVALAQDFDPNLANRYPGYAAPNAAPTVALRTFKSAPVGLSNQATGSYTGQNEFDVDRFDRASSPYAGGN